MKICVVGGIFDASDCNNRISPETTLVDGLRKRGLHVHASGHRAFQPADDYDIVHVHHLGKAALRMASEKSRALFVFTSHDGPLINGYERSILRKTAYRYVLAGADALVALSQPEARHLGRLAPAKAIRVIANGIPAGVFRPDADALELCQIAGPNVPHEILYVGQLIPLKGVDVLLDAFNKLRHQWNVCLKLVYHNAHLEARYRGKARELGMADRVVFAGRSSSEQLARCYRQADLVVLPSYAEALPSVVTEALLCGKPVVASAVGGIPQQLNGFGRLVPPGNAAELAAAMDSVLRDLARFRSQAGDMRRYAETQFAVDAMVTAHLSLYEDLVKSRRGRKTRRGWFDPFVRLAIRVYWARGKRMTS